MALDILTLWTSQPVTFIAGADRERALAIVADDDAARRGRVAHTQLGWNAAHNDVLAVLLGMEQQPRFITDLDGRTHEYVSLLW
jgi:hypothetical protein